MERNYKDYIEGFDVGLLASVLKNGEKFKGTEEKVDISYTGNLAPVVEKREICKITEKFIEANFDKLLQLKIIKEK